MHSNKHRRRKSRAGYLVSVPARTRVVAHPNTTTKPGKFCYKKMVYNVMIAKVGLVAFCGPQQKKNTTHTHKHKQRMQSFQTIPKTALNEAGNGFGLMDIDADRRQKLRISGVSMFPTGVLFILMMVIIYGVRRGRLFRRRSLDAVFWIAMLGVAFGLNYSSMLVQWPDVMNVDVESKASEDTQ